MSGKPAGGQQLTRLEAVLTWARNLPHRPLMLCCAALIAGMVLAQGAHPGVVAFGLVAIGSGVVVAACAFLAPGTVLAPLLIGFFALGGMMYEHRTRVPPTDVSHLTGAAGLALEGTVVAPPRDAGWRRLVRIEASAVSAGGRVIDAVTGRVETRVPREPELAVGDRVRLTGVSIERPEGPAEPGEFDHRAWLARQGVRCIATAQEIVVFGKDDSPGTRLKHVGMELRSRVVGAIEAGMPGADGPLYSRLLVGMVYGLDAAPLPGEIVEQFRRAGTVHLLVVSGAQVSMIAIAIVALTGAGVRGMRWWQALLASIGVLVLVLIVGMEASVGRAVGMFGLVILAALASRDYDVYTSVALAAAVILLADPLALLSLSFQLTFAATAGVIIFLPDDAIRRIDGSVARSPLPEVRAIIWGTAGAWMMTAPLLAHSVSGFALSGNLANLANIPLSGVVLLIGFVALPVALLCAVPGFETLLLVLCWAARGLLRLVMQVNELAAALPVPFVEGVHFDAAGVFAWYAAVAVLIVVGARERCWRALDEVLLRPHPSFPGVAGFAAAAALVCSVALPDGRPDALEMTLLPVGAGQCAVVRAPSGGTLMVDCGGGGNFAGAGQEVADGVVVPWLAQRRVERLDAVAISHWDADHCNALRHVLELVPAEMLLLPPELAEASTPEDLRQRIPARPLRAASGGRLDLGDGVSVDLLAPRMPLLRGTGDDANANSVVMMLTHGSVRMLLTGDIGEAGATRLLRDAANAGRSLRADVLVLPHHGRRLAQVEALLEAVRPQWAIASCDHDAEHYLGADEIALLQARGIRLLRTDEHGTVTVRSDGRRVTVNASRGTHSLGNWIAAARE